MPCLSTCLLNVFSFFGEGSFNFVRQIPQKHKPMSMRSTNGEVDETDQLLTELSNGPHSADVLRALLDALLVQKEDDDVLMSESSSHQSDEQIVSPQVMSKISNIFVEKLKTQTHGFLV